MMPQQEKIFLQQLLPSMSLGNAENIYISGVQLDSRLLQKDNLFIALVGEKIDGRQFVARAVEAGAAAIAVEADKQWQGVNWIGNVPVIAVEKLAMLVSDIAGRFYKQPSSKHRLIGITGTNGKTTCALLVAQLSAFLQKRAGVVGTLGYGFLDSTVVAPLSQQMAAIKSTGLTTPDPILLQKILADFVELQAATVAIEVSSHSLVQDRVAALQFDTAVFTNLTQDHLDFHGDLIAYGKAKEKLLNMPNLRHAIINADDAWAKSLLQKIPQGVAAISFSITDSSASIYLTNMTLTSIGAQARIHTPWGDADFESPFMGKFNISNLMAAIATLCVAGFSLQDVLRFIPQLNAAAGRMQSVFLAESNQDIHLIVDYAHTPDALEKTMLAIHEHAHSRLWVIFGCGGDRDKTKRPIMGRIAEKHSDYVIITNDNPRTEDPSAIAADIIRGLHNPNGCLVIADRAKAIDFAVQQAKPGDVVLVAGKGHEDYQIFAEQTIAFSDVQQSRLALQRRLAKRDIQSESTGGAI